MVTLYGSAEAEPFQSGYFGSKRLVRVKAASPSQSRYFESKRLVRELSKRHRLVASFQSGETRAQTAGCSPRRVKAADRSSSKRGKVYSCRHTVLYCHGGVQP